MNDGGIVATMGILTICQKQEHLLWVVLDHRAMVILVVGCQEQMISMVGDAQ